MIQYNDFELLYLMSESEIEAQEILYKKYTNLILSRIRKFKIQERYRDDFLQEGLLYLHKAIITFNPDNGKSFNKYFDLILQRRYIQILMKEKSYFYDVSLVAEVGIVSDKNSFEYNGENNHYYSVFEKEVLELTMKKYSPRDIAKTLGCDVKRIYNCLNRIRSKAKDILK